MQYALLEYFCDPLIRASSLGSLFLGAASGLIGALLALRRACLMAETMSHASYPGLMFSVFFVSLGSSQGTRFAESMVWVDAMAFLGAWIGSILGFYFYSLMLRARIGSDSALCWVLSSFLGLGVLMASHLQFQAPRLYQRAQSFLYGQAATLSDWHVLLFVCVWLIIALTLWLGHRPICLGHFDPLYSKTQGIYSKVMRIWIHFLTTALIVLGIRAGGVLVMAALLVAPAISARLLARSFAQMMVLSMLIGAFVGFMGNLLSLEIDSWAQTQWEHAPSLLPTGPAIALVGCSVAVLLCLLAPIRGWLPKWRRLRRLRRHWLEQLTSSQASPSSALPLSPRKR